jgi:hypothetical protein
MPPHPPPIPPPLPPPRFTARSRAVNIVPKRPLCPPISAGAGPPSQTLSAVRDRLLAGFYAVPSRQSRYAPVGWTGNEQTLEGGGGRGRQAHQVSQTPGKIWR